jgi:hypothetical protein
LNWCSLNSSECTTEEEEECQVLQGKHS